MAMSRPMTMVVMATKKPRHGRTDGWEGCTSGKGIRCSPTAVSVPGFALDSGGIAATGAAAEVSADGAWGTVLALPFCAGSSGPSTIPFIILEVDATFNSEADTPHGSGGLWARRGLEHLQPRLSVIASGLGCYWSVAAL